jgi:glycosyltransferase involved in cell wall biosynthesis
MRRILYVQYAMPGAYPPLQHSVAILTASGWQVRMLGRPIDIVESLSVDRDRVVDLRLLGGPRGGPLLKVHYIVFLCWALWHTAIWRPRWLYVSDAMAAPFGALVKLLFPRVGVVYHEHDEPTALDTSPIQTLISRARRWLVRRADVVIVPNAARAIRLQSRASTARPVHVVWNCPTRDEVHEQDPVHEGRLRVLYHGSINEARLPVAVVEALAIVPTAELHVIGYETTGTTAYLDRLREIAEQRGISDRLTFIGTMPRHDVLDACAQADVGLVFMSHEIGDDINQAMMVGASNKAFDYLACGVPFLVVDSPEWRDSFVSAGYAIACDASDAQSIAAALQWCATHRDAARAMGERGRTRVLEDWNYESQFAPVQAILEARST